MTSKKTKDRLRALRKKYHLGEFRRKKASKHKKIKVVEMRRHRKFKYHYRPSHRSRRGGLGGFGFAGLNVMDLAMMGFGAGFAGLIGAETSKLTGGKITGNTSQAIAAIGLYFVGKKVSGGKYTTPLAKGILIKTIGDLVEDHVVPMVSQRTGTITASSSGATFA
jgi:hypothetical protein